MSKKRMKTRLGADGYDYPYTSEGLVFDSEGKSIDQKYATKKDLESLSIVDELEERVSANEESIAWLLENGGGGGGTISCYISTTDAENFIISTGNDLTLHLDFFSPNVGKGTLKVFINDVESKSITIAQGDTANIIEGDLFNTGSNTMRVYVVDRTGNLTNELTFYVRYGSTQITSTFDPYISYDYGSIIRYYFTVTALDTSDTLTFYIKIDDELQNPISCKSEVRAYFTFPSTLSVGSHYCEAWAEDSVGKSNILKFNIVILDDRAVVVASDTQTLSVEEGSQVSLDYKVYMKGNTTFITKIYIDNEYSSSGTCGLETSFYKTSDLKEGIHTIKLEVWDINETVSDYVTWTVTITPSTYEMVTATTAGASAIFTAMNRLNSDENRETWIGTNQDGGQIVANLSNFAFNSESGWVDDNLIMSGNSAVEIPITPLANNAKYGFTLDIEFTSKAIGVEDALVLKLWDDTNNCGIKITTEELILRSKENNECRLYFTDNENTSVMFIIDRDEGFAKIYLNGVMCEAFHLNDYTVNGVAYLEDFTVNDTIKLGGSGYCQIKNLRVYEIALATNEILNNFISNETNKEAQRMLVEFQKGDNLPTLTIYGDFSGLGKDDKKPCDIVYLSTDVTKYGESFTLGGKKSSLQYQGTSSMAYPIKNYRINLCDSLGNKWKYNPFNGGQPESRFCLKADFITSNHAHNTGMAKFISDKLYNYDTSDESTMNPAKWWSINNGGKLTDTRETINGFPCRLILVNDGDTALNEGQAEPTPGNTKDMGIFNFNNDKDNVASLGLDNEIFPNCLSYEVTANSDTSAGAFVPYEPLPIIDIALIGENYATMYVPLNLFSTNNFVKTDGTITTAERYLSGNYGAYGYAVQLQAQDDGYIKLGHNDSGTHIRIQFSKNNPPTYIECKDGSKYALNIIPTEEYPNNVIKEPYIDMSGELEYLQNSFELRYPDADDYGDDYGYLGMETEVLKTDYYVAGGGTIYWSNQIEHDYFGSNELTVSDNVRDVIGYNSVDAITVLQKRDGKVDIKTTSEYPYIGIRWEAPLETCMVNGITLYAGEEVSTDTIKKNPYVEKGLSTNYGLKRVIDWVGNATNEEFVADFDKYFNRHYTLRYYLLVVLMAGVDNLGKNMMLDSFDGQIWYPRFYDIDTILSYDNSGEIKFDVDIEMEQGYWNTSASRLWTKIRDNFHDELVEVYKQMRGNGVTYEQIMHYMYDEQIAKIPQTYYNKDFDIKYAPYADQYIGKAHGDGYEHMKRWLKRRFTFCDTLFDYAPSYENDVLTIRANTLEEMHLTIDTYTPLYQHVSFYNGNMEKIKITPGQPVTFSGTAQTATDQEVLIYGGSNIKKITGISTCNPNSMLIGFAPRLTELDISNCPILTIVNSNKANFSPHTYLNKLNISNCPQLGGNLNVSNSPLLQEINARGSAITGLLLPTSLRNLKTLELPNTISSLALYDAGVLENLKFDEGVVMQSIELSNCPGITNTENFDLTQTPTVILDNSYDTEELYMSATTNLTLRNMKNMERVIYTPNEEYSEFDINNVINGKNYKITTSSCPKLKTFITTAPHRYSYNNVEWESRYPITNIECDTIVSQGTDTSTGEIKTGTGGVSTEEYYLIPKGCECTITTSGTWLFISEFDMNKVFLGSLRRFDSDKDSNIYTYTFSPTNDTYIRMSAVGASTTTITIEIVYLESEEPILVKIYGDITPNTSFTANTLDLSSTQFTDIKLLCTTDVYNLKVPTTMKNFYCDSAMDIDTDVIEDASYEVIHEELIEPYTTNYEGEVARSKHNTVLLSKNTLENISVEGGSILTYTSNTTLAEVIREYDSNANLLVENNTHTIKTLDSSTGLYKGSIILNNDTSYINIIANNTNEFKVTLVESFTPNIIPSSANGSLIFNMYSNNTTQPTSTSPYMWDLTGLKLNDFYTYGMNNWVKPSDDSYIKIANNSELIHAQGVVKRNVVLGSIHLGETNSYKSRSMGVFKLKAGSYKFTTDNGTGMTIYYSETIGGNQSFSGGGTASGNTVRYDKDMYFCINVDNTTKWLQINDTRFVLSEIRELKLSGDFNLLDHTTVIEELSTYSKLNEVKSITMPQRMPGYSVRLVNADITPNEYPTMLYPKLIDVTLPITGKLDYTKYNGSSLAWAYAYTTDDVSINPLGSQEQVNITNDYNKLYGTDFVDIVDVWVYKDTDVSRFSTNEAITTAYIELTKDNYKTRVDEILAFYPNCTDVYFFEDGNMNDLSELFIKNTTSRNQIEHITFMEGYFDKVTTMRDCIRVMPNLLTITNLPKNLTIMSQAFYGCSKLTTINAEIPSTVITLSGAFRSCASLNQLIDLSNVALTDGNGLVNAFYQCNTLTIPPILPSNYKGSMNGTFYNCTSLTTAPEIPQGVTDMQYCFAGCTALTTVPNIPLGETYWYNTFQNCENLVSVPINGWKGNMWGTFDGCSSLNQQINIETTTKLEATFYKCTSLSIPPTLPVTVTNCSMQQCFQGCTSLTTAPTIPQGVTNMASCFYKCTSLTQAPNIPNSVTNISMMLALCEKVTSITLPLANIQTYNGALNSTGITDITWVGERNSDFDITNLYFTGCSQEDIQELVPEHLADVKSLGTTATLTLGETYGAYLTPDEVFSANAKGWTIVGASSDFTIVNASVDTSTLTTDESVLSCFMELTSANYKTRLNEVLAHYPNCTDLYLFDDGSVTNLNYMITTVSQTNNQTYKGQIQKVIFVDGYFENLNSMERSFNIIPNLVEVDLNGIKGKINNFQYIFVQCPMLETIKMDKLDLKELGNVSHMFYDCAKFNGLVDFSNSPLSMYALANTFRGCKALTITPKLPSNISGLQMNGTFYDCTSLTTAPTIPQGVTNMQQCFNNCSSLTTAPEIPSSVTNMYYCFAYCSALTEPSIVPSSCTNLEYCFRDCKTFTVIDTTDWDTSNVTNMTGLFYGCSNLTEIKGIENWNTSKVTGVWDLFYGCGSIEYIDLSKWDMSKMSSTGCMYRNCGSLKVAYLPLRDGIPNNALQGCRADLDIVWMNERKTDLNLGTYSHANGFREEDIQELVPEHLEDLHKDEIKISFSKKEITINNTKTTWEEE